METFLVASFILCRDSKFALRVGLPESRVAGADKAAAGAGKNAGQRGITLYPRLAAFLLLARNDHGLHISPHYK